MIFPDSWPIKKPSRMFFFFLQVLRLYATLWVMTDFRYLYIHDLAWLFALSLSISAWSRRRHWYDCDFWVFPS